MDFLLLNGVLCVHTWTSGLRVVAHAFRIVTEEDVLARCMWLERRGRQADAECLLEEYCSRK
jgi:hypothetical protein